MAPGQSPSAAHPRSSPVRPETFWASPVSRCACRFGRQTSSFVQDVLNNALGSFAQLLHWQVHQKPTRFAILFRKWFDFESAHSYQERLQPSQAHPLRRELGMLAAYQLPELLQRDRCAFGFEFAEHAPQSFADFRFDLHLFGL